LQCNPPVTHENTNKKARKASAPFLAAEAFLASLSYKTKGSGFGFNAAGKSGYEFSTFSIELLLQQQFKSRKRGRCVFLTPCYAFTLNDI
jgi:hypothetical protein